MRSVLLFALVGCASTSTNPPPPSQPAVTGTESKPSEPTPSEPTPAEPTPSEPTLVDGVYVTYTIDGRVVGRATFEALFGRLDVDAKPFGGETVEDPDGGYGGAGELFHARDGSIEYRYEHHVYPRQDGSAGETRMLVRVTP